MKIKLGQLLEVEQEVVKIIQHKVAISHKYWLGKLLEQAQKEREDFIKVRDEAIKEHGTKTKDGNFEIKPNTKKAEEFQKQINTLLQEEVEVNINKFPLSMFDNVETEEYYPFFITLFVEEPKA